MASGGRSTRQLATDFWNTSPCGQCVSNQLMLSFALHDSSRLMLDNYFELYSLSERTPAIMIDELPKLPQFDCKLINECKGRNDPRPLLFEWFKTVTMLTIAVGSIDPISTGYRQHDRVHVAVVRGLACRCGRLMHSIAKLSCDGYGGESSGILARCIAESALVLEWLTGPESPSDAFQRYLADGLRTDIELECKIRTSIRERGGSVLAIEKRMLASIKRSRKDAEMSIADVKAAKRLPDVKSMMLKSEYSEGHYFGIQRMMSQFIHGTWTDLRSHYIIKTKNGDFSMKDIDDSPVNPNAMAVIILSVINALRSLWNYFIGDTQLIIEFTEYADIIEDGVLFAHGMYSPNDYNVVE